MEGINSSCGLYFSSHELLLLNVVHPFFAFMSSVFCILAIVIVWCCKLQQHLSYRLVIYWLFSNALFSSVLGIYLPIGWYDPESIAFVGYCKFLAVFLLYSVWTVLLMTVVMVMAIFSLVVLSSQISNKLEVPSVLLSFFCPLLFCWIPFTTGSYGFNGPGCSFIVKDENCNIIVAGTVEWFVLLVLPGGILFLLCILAVIVVVFAFALRSCVSGRNKEFMGSRDQLADNQEQQEELNRKYKKALKEALPLLVYPVAYGGLALFVIMSLITNVTIDSGKFEISLARAMAMSMIGLGAALATMIHLAISARKAGRKRKRLAVGQSYRLPQQTVKNSYVLTTIRSDTVTHSTEHIIPYESDI